MLDYLFGSILTTTESGTTAMTGSAFLACCIASLVLGVCIAFIYMYKHKYSKNFVVTLALLPVIVQMVISLVNGNIGAGVAVMGVFSLVRFRSIPGTAKDICAVFLAMAVGLATGMGYIGMACLFTVVVGIANAIFVSSPLGEKKAVEKAPKLPKIEDKTLKITVPEDVDYVVAFNDVFDHYCSHRELVSSKTTNMGSLFQLEYVIGLNDSLQEKAFLDALRTRNGNLAISFGRLAAGKETL